MNTHKVNSQQLRKEISEELKTGLHWVPEEPVIAMFGSARLLPGDPAYEKALHLAQRLAGEGWCVVTGGGPGIMEAANRGAFCVGGKSVGLNIKLPHEQIPNPYQTQSLVFQHFTSRKAVFVRRADIFIAFDGGFGTLDEVFDTITQIQTGKLPLTTMILLGVEFWSPLVQWINSTLVNRGVISREETKLFKLVDTTDEAYEFIKHLRQTQEDSKITMSN